jgi:hypothetical protein
LKHGTTDLGYSQGFCRIAGSFDVAGNEKRQTMSDRPTLRERMRELKRQWFHWGEQEVRHTAVEWRPDGRYVKDENKTPSGEKEYYRVVRKAKDNGRSV